MTENGENHLLLFNKVCITTTSPSKQPAGQTGNKDPVDAFIGIKKHTIT